MCGIFEIFKISPTTQKQKHVTRISNNETATLKINMHCIFVQPIKSFFIFKCSDMTDNLQNKNYTFNK